MTAREVMQEIIKASRIKTGAIRSANVATVCAIALLAKPNIQARFKHLNDEALEIEQLHAPFTAMPAGRADR